MHPYDVERINRLLDDIANAAMQLKLSIAQAAAIAAPIAEIRSIVNGNEDSQ